MPDYISREAANKAVCELCGTSEGTFCVRCDRNPLQAIPAADVKPVVRGKWIKKEPYEVWKCSVCEMDNKYAYSYGDDDYELQDIYCPQCGANMDGSDKNA